MPLRSIVLLVYVAIVAAFVALNWSSIVAPAPLFFGVTRTEGPLGLVLVALLGALSLALFVYLLFFQTGALLESRRHARELQAQRERADEAESSRITELRRYMEARFDAIERSISNRTLP